MSHREQVRAYLSANKPLVVGAIADPGSFQEDAAGCDILELRLDSLGTGSDVLDFAENSPLPLLVTARGKAEGGQSDWSLEDREQAYRMFLPFASLIDIELRDFDHFENLVTEAKQQQIVIIGSFHNFESTPSPEQLLLKFDDRPDLHKFALMANTAHDIRTHLLLLEIDRHGPLSVMGMGPLGAAARPLMAKAGSVLNYGYLGKTPTAPNQWPASLLGEALSV